MLRNKRNITTYDYKLLEEYLLNKNMELSSQTLKKKKNLSFPSSPQVSCHFCQIPLKSQLKSTCICQNKVCRDCQVEYSSSIEIYSSMVISKEKCFICEETCQCNRCTLKKGGDERILIKNVTCFKGKKQISYTVNDILTINEEKVIDITKYQVVNEKSMYINKSFSVLSFDLLREEMKENQFESVISNKSKLKTKKIPIFFDFLLEVKERKCFCCVFMDKHNSIKDIYDKIDKIENSNIYDVIETISKDSQSLEINKTYEYNYLSNEYKTYHMLLPITSIYDLFIYAEYFYIKHSFINKNNIKSIFDKAFLEYISNYSLYDHYWICFNCFVKVIQEEEGFKVLDLIIIHNKKGKITSNFKNFLVNSQEKGNSSLISSSIQVCLNSLLSIETTFSFSYIIDGVDKEIEIKNETFSTSLQSIKLNDAILSLNQTVNLMVFQYKTVIFMYIREKEDVIYENSPGFSIKSNENKDFQLEIDVSTRVESIKILINTINRYSSLVNYIHSIEYNEEIDSQSNESVVELQNILKLFNQIQSLLKLVFDESILKDMIMIDKDKEKDNNESKGFDAMLIMKLNNAIMSSSIVLTYEIKNIIYLLLNVDERRFDL